ncbi:MAG TPA: hypothetical protein VKZ63_16720 [Kofleriaceae bacterium]|nr:hypothetical protein [Kofleriaceae bacterium]
MAPGTTALLRRFPVLLALAAPAACDPGGGAGSDPGAPPGKADDPGSGSGAGSGAAPDAAPDPDELADPCATHPWPGERGCADALGRAGVLGPAVEPQLEWSVDYVPLADDPLYYWFAEHLRVDRHGRLFALVSTSRDRDSLMVYDGETGEATGISGEARIALGTDDTLYTCLSTETGGSAVRAYDVTPPLTAPLEPLWEAAIGPAGNYGPCSQLEVLPGGLVIAVLQATMTAIEPDGSIRFQASPGLAVRTLAAVPGGPIVVDAVVSSGPITRALVAIDRESGAVAWSAPLGEQYHADQGLLGALESGALAFRPSGAGSEVFHQAGAGASSWTIAHDDANLLAAGTPDRIFVSGARRHAWLDPVAPALEGITDTGWSGGRPLRVISDQRGHVYLLADRGGGQSRHTLYAYDAAGALLWQRWVGNAPDFALGPDGWLFVSWRGGLAGYHGAP